MPKRDNTEKEIWVFSTGTGKNSIATWIVSSPAVANGIVYIGSDDHKIYALNAETGALIWNYTTGGDVQGPLIVPGGGSLRGLK